ncbi:DUF2066 domain-containing protein [Vibrio kagoshimensis]|uniref:DUF2066 domain-containing protein n=1 Tax=Vibrio kagoshimensis TaxID=2910244 RepID=UPI003D25A0C9
MRYIALLLMVFLSLPSYALTQVDIFSSEVVINGENKQPETVARNTGMQQVLVRATGLKDVASNDMIKKAMRQSSQYISQLSYGEQGDQTTLRMRFNSAQIRSLLTQAQLPYWPDTRSNILVWLVEEQNFDKNIVWEHSASELAAGLQINAETRGLPLILPVGDFDDITGIATSDLWGGFVGPISTASQRYPADAVLVIKSQGNSLRWTLYDQQPAFMTSSPKAPLSGSASSSKQLIDEVSHYYASKSAVTVASESSESILAQFISINNAKNFFELENALKRLNSVASLDILKIQNSEVTFRIHLLSTQQEFEQEVERIRQVTAIERQSDMPEVAPGFEKQVNTQTVGDESEALEVVEQSSIEGVFEGQDGESTELNEAEIVVPVQEVKPDLVYEWLTK